MQKPGTRNVDDKSNSKEISNLLRQLGSYYKPWGKCEVLGDPSTDLAIQMQRQEHGSSDQIKD
jgi:hypothetical protein